jgi:hypothetical protein
VIGAGIRVPRHRMRDLWGYTFELEVQREPLESVSKKKNWAINLQEGKSLPRSLHQADWLRSRHKGEWTCGRASA